MNTWLSGMSPVALEVASACSAEGPEPVVVWADVVPGPVVPGPDVAGELLLLEPQPATSSAAAKRRTVSRAGIGGNGPLACLNDA